MSNVILITGATSGIGLAAARLLTGRGERVIIHGRSEAKCRSCLGEIHRASQAEPVGYEVADFESLGSIREMAERIRESYGSLDVLINNAGCFTTSYRETIDGYELQWGVNYLAPFLLTRELLPLLLRSDDGRVVTVSSGSHPDGKIHWENPNLTERYNGLRAYRQSKLANVLFSYELHRRYAVDTTLSTYAVEPGLVDTRIAEKHSGWLAKLVWRFRTRNALTPEEGAETLIYTATDPEIADRSGEYWKECRPVPSSPATYDEGSAARLWEMSQRMVMDEVG